MKCNVLCVKEKLSRDVSEWFYLPDNVSERLRGTIQRITNERMSEACELSPYLVSKPSDELYAEARGVKRLMEIHADILFRYDS